MYTRTILVLAGLLAVALTPASAAVIVNFDEFPSPPVTCCYGNPVRGPLVYADVTVHDGLGHGQVMNGTGWDNNQTSGNNLFGTAISSEIDLDFTHAADNLALDIINGTSSNGADYTLSLFDASHTNIGNVTMALAAYGGSGPHAPNVGHFSTVSSGVWFATITTDDPSCCDIAIDTISIANARRPVPEPMSLALVCAGLAGISTLRRRKK